MGYTFDLPLLQAVSDWQRGGSARQKRRRGEALKAACAALPLKYRNCSLCCFRQIALPKGGVWNLIGENRLPETISAWTVDIEVAKHLKSGVPPEGQGYQGVIFCVHPAAESIVVNIRELYRDSNFVAELDRNKSRIAGYYDGAGRYSDKQSEVVLEISSVTQQDVYSLGGHSSPFDQLVDRAAELIYGRRPSPEEREGLMLKAEHVRSEAGPEWLSIEATQRVLMNMKPHAQILGEIKRLQNEG